MEKAGERKSTEERARQEIINKKKARTIAEDSGR